MNRRRQGLFRKIQPFFWFVVAKNGFVKRSCRVQRVPKHAHRLLCTTNGYLYNETVAVFVYSSVPRGRSHGFRGFRSSLSPLWWSSWSTSWLLLAWFRVVRGVFILATFFGIVLFLAAFFGRVVLFVLFFGEIQFRDGFAQLQGPSIHLNGRFFSRRKSTNVFGLAVAQVHGGLVALTSPYDASVSDIFSFSLAEGVRRVVGFFVPSSPSVHWERVEEFIIRKISL